MVATSTVSSNVQSIRTAKQPVDLALRAFWWCLLPALVLWPVVGCSGFDVGVYAEVTEGSQISVTINADKPDISAELTTNLSFQVLLGSFGTGELVLRRVVLEYCVPRKGSTLTGEEVLRSSCVRVNSGLTQLEIPALRLVAATVRECAQTTGPSSPCYFPGGKTPLELVVLNDVGTEAPTNAAWKAPNKEGKETKVFENIDGKRISTAFFAGPCNHPDYIELNVFIGFKDDPDTSYAIRSNGTATTMYAQSSSKARFKLKCLP